jgi:ribonuclease P protein component
LRTAHLEVRVIASPRSHCRIGFIVAKYGRSSVERNRVKRRLRELTRRQLLGTLRQLRPCVDVVIRAKREAYDAPMTKLQSELDDLGTRIARFVSAAGLPADGA